MVKLPEPEPEPVGEEPIGSPEVPASAEPASAPMPPSALGMGGMAAAAHVSPPPADGVLSARANKADQAKLRRMILDAEVQAEELGEVVKELHEELPSMAQGTQEYTEASDVIQACASSLQSLQERTLSLNMLLKAAMVAGKTRRKAKQLRTKKAKEAEDSRFFTPEYEAKLQLIEKTKEAMKVGTQILLTGQKATVEDLVRAQAAFKLVKDAEPGEQQPRPVLYACERMWPGAAVFSS
jgi:hypothetical protein